MSTEAEKHAAKIRDIFKGMEQEYPALLGAVDSLVEEVARQTEARVKAERDANTSDLEAIAARDAAFEEAAIKAKSMGLQWGVMRSMKMTNHADAAGKIEEAIRAMKSKRKGT